ncbi:MAG: 50S ribosomal protein L18 [Acidobacteria bacterium]|nr:50S ribosomal protein L18 [Acidobacteriota bacterium]
MKIKTKLDSRRRIKMRIRKRVHGTGVRPRLSVFRSVEHMYVQAIDDTTGQTLASAATTEPALKAVLTGGAKGGNLNGAKTIGKTIAERLRARGIMHVVFDRSGFLYHGRVKAVADAAREAGLEF